MNMVKCCFMSAYIGFAGKKESPIDFISIALRDIWADYAQKGWAWKLRNDAGHSDLGLAIQVGEQKKWVLTRMSLQLTDEDFNLDANPLSPLLANIERAYHQLPVSAAIFEITRTSYNECHAPMDITPWGVMGVVGEITNFMEDVVGVEKDSPDPWVGGGLGFIKWLKEGDGEDRLRKVAACQSHSIYVAACDQGNVSLVRSQGANAERQFIVREKDCVIFSSSHDPLFHTGAMNIEQIPPGAIRTYPL